MEVIVCDKLTKKQRQMFTLKDLSLSIQENTIIGVIGRNGAGKTTLLKILAGLWRGSSGNVRVFGEDPFNSLRVSANTIYISNEMVFPSSLSLSALLTEAGRFYPSWNDRIARRLFDYFAFRSNDLYTQLSTGKRNTFNAIIGLSSRCPITIFDEPTTGMDQAVRNDFYRALLKDYLEVPRTILFSSHHLEEIEELLEYVLLLDKGKKQFYLPMDELKHEAIGLTGRTELIYTYIHGKTVIYRESMGADTTYVVVKANEVNMGKAKRLGIHVTPVSASDICVYVTSSEKGGIDHVYQ
ncbi:ATP-binding cassette domain-containing protein [Virgibacillus pantothenticus]|uniref:ABC transporter n=1 Tax=Virgibacillus pantothenticus TaxID=1473 RepID=A0A0L0QK21_VIRPA|nr:MULTISPECIES: ATP-binding cassette domain-containing protein [Virgibacillus]API92782.1 ABC transporter [Virgibacillus sp. 6R]KNE18980.1 ABC transporter [Virgibacillus pantothenticus]MBS7428289.1 ABC transporter ATP-binding protein [Virgibacillus sp. 19R1-5]MBU8565278.1 ATP-binding cassette domain-containing protein [Virgibacillus pantothenticus]MBU8599503.1 ATP-binding cassette domain-containing protein [Virgibacillus pantothenticus]